MGLTVRLPPTAPSLETSIMSVTTSRRSWQWLGLCVALAAGCNPPEAVRTYEAPRETPNVIAPTTAPTAPLPVAEGADRSRLLGVIVPTGPKTFRFVKFSGAIDRVTATEAKFDEFVDSLRLANPSALPTYTVPAGWTENPPRQFVAKSFRVGLEENPQVTLSGDGIGGTLLANVNRWRAEVGLPAVTEAELPKSVTEVSLGDTKAYRVDLRGPAAPSTGQMGTKIGSK